MIDPTETGESVEPNALPWDKIPAASYSRLGSFSKVLPELRKLHDERVKSDPEFRYVLEDIVWYKAEKSKKTVSLNEAVRIKEKDELDSRALARTNERLHRMGKPAVKKLDEVPTGLEMPDGYLQEAANITADLVRLN